MRKQAFDGEPGLIGRDLLGSHNCSLSVSGQRCLTWFRPPKRSLVPGVLQKSSFP
jgi:hypothetical protein